MTGAPRVPAAFLVGVGLTTGAALAAEIAFTRIFSITLWHHFAYLVVGLALLGFGAAGAFLAARGGALLPADGPLAAALARRARLAAFATFAAFACSGTVRCDSLRLFESPANFVALALLVLLSTVPFVGAGCVLSTALSAIEGRAGGVYAADLLGAGLGAAIAPAAIGLLGGPGLIFASAAATGVGSLAFALRAGPRETAKSAVVALLLVAAAFVFRDDDPWVRPAPLKEIYAFDGGAVALDRPVRNVAFRRWTPLGRIDVSGEMQLQPMMGGEFGTASSTLWTARGLTQDGAAPTVLYRLQGDPSSLTFLPHGTTGAVWEAREARGDRGADRVLVIGVGGGIDVAMALSRGARRVVGVEVNPVTLSLLTDRFREFTGDLGSRPGVELHAAEGRAFVRSSRERFDVIQMSGVDTYAALSSGAYSVAEAYLYTVEAFADYLDHLAPGGIVSASRFILEPPRETLRLAGVAAEALRRRGVADPARHLAVLRGSIWASLLCGERPFGAPELERLRSFAAAEGYRLAFDPERPGDTPFDRLLRGDEASRDRFVAGYGHRVDPVSDDSPFFFNYFRWRNLASVVRMRPGDPLYTQAVPIGHAILLATFVGTALLAVLGILRPLRRKTFAGAGRGFGVYFGALGIAYLFVEIAFLQKLTFFLGHPTYALSVVLAGMLVASGLGSAVSRRVASQPVGRFLPHAIVATILLAALATRLLLPSLLGLSFGARLAVALLVLAPVGFVMGMPFPAGLELLRARAPGAIPWAFGVNASFTVIASTLSTLVALEGGFTLLFVLAACAYAAGFIALRGEREGTGAARGVPARSALP